METFVEFGKAIDLLIDVVVAIVEFVKFPGQVIVVTVVVVSFGSFCVVSSS